MTSEQDVVTELNLTLGNANPTLEEQAAEMAQEQTGGEESPIPAKFRDAADPVAEMAKAYTALERKLSEGAPAPEMKIEKSEGLQDLTTAELSTLGEEWSRNGDLTEDSYAGLAKRGITKEVVDIFVQAQVQQADASRRQTLMDAGLDDNTWQSMSDWASRNWSEDQVNEWNELASSSSPLARKLAVENLKQAYGGPGRGQDAMRLEGKSSTGAFTPFRSDAEMLEAMKDSRYDKDPAYREDVDRRVELMLRANNRL